MTMNTPGSEKRRLIVNADDFGESLEVNKGIIEAHRNGIVTSTSLLTNMPAFEHALTCIKDAPTLDVGIHLNVHRGIPITTCTYLTRNGEFLSNSLSLLFRSYINKRCAKKEIFQEFEAQIKKALSAGVRISHLDTDKHLHTLPFIFDIVLTLAERYNIPTVRLPYESFTFSSFLNPSQLHKTIVMALFAPLNTYLLKKSACKGPDYFYGVSSSKKFSVTNVMKLFSMLRPGVTELSCHPGHPPKSIENYIDAYRQKELQTLTDPELRAFVAEHGIVLSTFSDIR